MKQSDARRILLVLLGVTSCSTVLLVLRCSRHIDELDVLTPALNQPVPERLNDKVYLGRDDAQERLLLSSNMTDVQTTGRSIVLQMIKGVVDVKERARRNMTSARFNVTGTDHLDQYVDMLEIMQRAAKSLVDPVSYNNEFEVVPFTRFAVDRVYPVDPGLGRRVIEKPIGYRKLEIHRVIEHAVDRLTRQTGQKFSASDFIEGIYRSVPSIGTQYELYFRDKMQYRKVVVVLPNVLPYVVSDETVSERKDMVHILMALSQRVNIFQKFLRRFKQLLTEDNNIDLTVVYFGHIGLEKVQSLVRKFNTEEKSERVHLLTTTDKFSRGRGLQIGADSLQNNSLLFMSDVDIVFTTSFLERCRLHTSLGHSVYYPIVFSLYNPAIIAQLQYTTRSPEKKPIITRDTGFWRDFGYGMTCQYRADFISVQGFGDEVTSNQSLAGWGLEDVHLYRKHLHSGKVTVIRATDPGIFHIWHKKTCPRSLSEDQYKGCLRSQALSEASQAQLGMLLLQNMHTTATP